MAICYEAGYAQLVIHTLIRSARIWDATKPLAPVKKTLLSLCAIIKRLIVRNFTRSEVWYELLNGWVVIYSTVWKGFDGGYL
jgi:hypothetical protein